jgi:hypothetical protein
MSTPPTPTVDLESNREIKLDVAETNNGPQITMTDVGHWVGHRPNQDPRSPERSELTFGVNKGQHLEFQADHPFSMSEFTKDGNPVAAPWTIDTHFSQGEKVGEGVQASYVATRNSGHGPTDPRKFILYVKVNTGDDLAGKYHYGVTLADYHGDPEMDVESG